MTLLRQLIIVIVALFALLFAGALAINIHNTRGYLNDQLRTISQDMATSLGLSLSPHLGAGELKIAESMVNAVSDSGYYREVVVSDINGKPLIVRSQTPVIEGVPAWFVAWIPLETPVGEALVMSGWQQAGTVRISANPGYAYRTLWSNSVDALWWFLGSSLLVFGLGVVALHLVLRPLREVERQAKAICDREYLVQRHIPWTLELRSVVSAMNLMAEKVKEMFREQADAMERLRASTYVDPVCGIANRQYFELQLRQITKQRAVASTNALAFVELADFKELNERRGYQAGNALLAGCAAALAEACRTVPNLDYFVARVGGTNFAVVVQDTTAEDIQALAAELSRSLPQLRQRGLTDSTRIGHVGIAMHRGQSASELLAAADVALRLAQAGEACGWRIEEAPGYDPQAAIPMASWREILAGVLAERRIALFRQPCVACRDGSGVVQQEVLMRIHDADGTVIPANTLIPAAKHLRLTQALDRAIIADVLARLELPANAGLTVAVNLFPPSIRDPEFVAWVADALHQHPQAASRLAFEMAEHGALADLDALRAWVDMVTAAGGRAGLDQVGRGFRPFGYLGEIRLGYIKIDGSYARGIDTNRDNQFFVDSLVKYAHSLDITVIAESVETEAERTILAGLHVDAVKGYGIGKPESWQ